MGNVKRKTSKYIELYRKKFRKKVLTVLSFSPPGINKNDFIKLFSEIYPEDIVSIEKHFLFYQKKNQRRNNIKSISFPTPSNLLYKLAKAKIVRKSENEWSSAQAKIAKNKALIEAELEKRKKQQKYRNNNISTQNVTPKFIINLINRYWKEDQKIRRLLIVIECSKFKNSNTILLFRQVMAGEKDWFIRNYCFRILQRFDEVVYLPPKGKGKRGNYNSLVDHFGCDFKDDIGRTPENIIKELYGENYIELTKSFDVFISHATSNADLVEDLVMHLNSAGLVAFVDWKSDRQDLNRSKFSCYTKQVLEMRMKQSKCLLLIRTKESDLSKWVSWEIEYFIALNKKVAVLNFYENSDSNKNALIDSFPIAKFKSDNLLIIDSEKSLSLIEWIS